MADITSIQSDLSNGTQGTVSNAPVASIATTQTSSRPVDLIKAQQQQDSTIGNIRYPADLPTYYMQLDIQAYQRMDLMSIGQTKTLCSVGLPLPAKLIDTQQTKYEQKSFTRATSGNMVNAAVAPGSLEGATSTLAQVGQAANQALNGNLSQAAGTLGTAVSSSSGLKSTATGLGIDGLQAAGQAAGFGDDAVTAVKAATGYSPNYFLTVLLDGPQYKTHNFTWTFSPRTPAESESLNRIIRVMNNAMAPGLAFSGAVFTFPRVFRIQFCPNPRYLYKFKPAVLVNFTVDYSGGGIPSFYRTDSATNGKNAPVQITIQASFLELEFWLRSDFGSGDYGEGTDGLPDTPLYSTGTGRDIQ